MVWQRRSQEDSSTRVAKVDEDWWLAHVVKVLYSKVQFTYILFYEDEESDNIAVFEGMWETFAGVSINWFNYFEEIFSDIKGNYLAISEYYRISLFCVKTHDSV